MTWVWGSGNVLKEFNMDIAMKSAIWWISSKSKMKKLDWNLRWVYHSSITWSQKSTFRVSEGLRWEILVGFEMTKNQSSSLQVRDVSPKMIKMCVTCLACLACGGRMYSNTSAPVSKAWTFSCFTISCAGGGSRAFGARHHGSQWKTPSPSCKRWRKKRRDWSFE